MSQALTKVAIAPIAALIPFHRGWKADQAFLTAALNFDHSPGIALMADSTDPTPILVSPAACAGVMDGADSAGRVLTLATDAIPVALLPPTDVVAVVGAGVDA